VVRDVCGSGQRWRGAWEHRVPQASFQKVEGHGGHRYDAGFDGGGVDGGEEGRVRPGEGDSGFASVSQLLRIGGTEVEHHAGDLVLHSEETDVFRTHDRFEVFDMSGAEGADGNSAQAIGKRGVVEEYRCDLSLADGDEGHAVLRETVSNGDAFGDAADGGDDLIANLIGIGSECEAHGDLFRDDVALGAAVNHADGEDGGLLRIDLAGNDGLREDDELCCHQDGVLAGLRG
jgi:hypothetical protein